MLRILCAFIFLSAPVYSTISWSTPFNLSTSSQNAFLPAVAANLPGTAVATWTYNSVQNVVQSSTFQYNSSGGIWSFPVPVSTQAALGGAIGQSSVAMDSLGNSVAVWPQSASSTNYDVFSANLPVGGSSWTINSFPAAVYSFDPYVTVDYSNHFHTIWEQDGTAAGATVQVATAPTPGTNWTPDTFPVSDTNAALPRLAYIPSGDGAAVWQADNPAVIQASIFSSNAWSSPPLAIAGSDSTNPKLAISFTGTIIIVWQKVTLSGSVIQVKSSSDGWATTTDLSDPLEYSINPDIAVDPFGNFVVVWQHALTSLDLAPDIKASSLRVGNTDWSTAATLSVAGQAATNPKVAVTPAGMFFAVWQGSNGTNTIIQASTTEVQPSSALIADTWTATPNLSFPGGNASDPQIASDASGGVTVVWQRSNSSNTQVIQAANTISALLAPSPASNLTGNQVYVRFLFESEFSNVLHWTASPSLYVASYNIYRNGVLIANVPSTQLYYNNVDQQQGVSVMYAVTAVDVDGNESSAITVTVS